MKPYRRASAAEKLDPATPRLDSTRWHAGTTNAHLPEQGQNIKSLRARLREAFPFEDPNGGIFVISEPVKRAQDPPGADNVHRPSFLRESQNRDDNLEATIARQENQFPPHHTEAASRCDIKQQQAEALRGARDTIEELKRTVSALQATLGARENEVRDAKRDLSHSDEERQALQSELAETKKELAERLQKQLELNVAFNDRATAIAIASERIASLEAELSAKIEENRELTMTIEAAETRRHDASAEGYAQLESRFEELKALLAARDEQTTKMNWAINKLATCCEQLSHHNNHLESERIHTLDTLKAQAASISSLELALRADREAAERRIAELIAAIQREREEHCAAERESAETRREIALLLPKLAMSTRAIQ